MKYRLVKKCDLNHIVDLHLKVRDTYDIGFFSKMNRSFLKTYYRINIEDPFEIILCAEDENGEICGFCSGSLNVEKQTENMKRHRLQLAWAAIPSLLKKPDLILELLNRYHSSIGKNRERFIVSSGARSEYWTWDRDKADPVSSVELLNTLYKMFFILGVQEVSFEVDAINAKVLKFHELNGAKVADEFELPDGRNRKIMKYDLLNKYE